MINQRHIEQNDWTDTSCVVGSGEDHQFNRARSRRKDNPADY